MYIIFLGTSLECFSCAVSMDFRGNRTDCELIYDSYENRSKRLHCINPGSVCAKYIVERKYYLQLIPYIISCNFTIVMSTKCNRNYCTITLPYIFVFDNEL